MNLTTYGVRYSISSLSGLLITFSLQAATVTNLQGQPPSTIQLFQQNSVTTFSTIKPVQQHTDNKGIVHKKYLQSFKGIPVWGQNIVTHQKGSDIFSINGTLVEDIGVDIPVTQAAFDQTEAITKAKTWVTQQDPAILWDYQQEKADLFIYVDESQQAQLVYQVDLLARSTDPVTNGIKKVTRPQFIIDALTGIILKQWEGLTNNKIGTGPGGNIRMTGEGIMPIAPYEYGVDFDFLDVEEMGNGNCRLATPDVMTIKYDDGTWNAHIYSCPRNDYLNGETVNGAYGPLNDVHFAGQKVFDMYRAWYGEVPLPSSILPLHMYAHIPDYDNAAWDGSAVWFGGGSDYFHPMVAIDIVAHEISHGFTEYHSNLQYYGQSGGINESFSDMAGEAAEFYILGKNDWYGGAYIAKMDGPLNGDPLKYICEPTLDGVSIDNVADYNDWMDVHYSSGIFNKAFCLLAKTAGWNTKKAFEVMLKANGNWYWSPQSGFVDAACGAVLAAKDMGYKAADVYYAFLGVGADAIAGGCPLCSSESSIAAIYSNDTRQAIIPCLEMPPLLDPTDGPLGLSVVSLYTAVLEIPFGFSDFRVNQLTFVDKLTTSNPNNAKFDPDTGVLTVPSVDISTITPSFGGQTAAGFLVNCNATLRESVLKPEVLKLIDLNCQLPPE
ncbi:elastase [Thioploca ingrica]|uniref:Neutral metalloproteinase n=1 Tax=Thioploca ingrica TaxID=40754 RepID=A0A090AJ85_9GAMM|nr:elastase [Thioploca ingrica]